MAKKDLVDELVDIVHPLPERSPDAHSGDDSGDDPGFDAWIDQVAEHRAVYEQNARLSWEEGDQDPLMAEIHSARQAIAAAQERLRLALAYGREFSRPRPYRLEDLGHWAGLTISGVRTAYKPTDVAEVERRIGRPPYRETNHAKTGA